MRRICGLVRRFVREEEGMELVEYALMAALAALAVVTAIGFIASAVGGKFTETADTIDPGTST